MARNKKNNDDGKTLDPSPWMKPVNVTAIVIALIGGLTPLGGAAAIGDALKQSQSAQYDCSAEIDKAFDEYDKDPTVRVLVTGPVQDQCKINEKLARYAAAKKK